MAPSEDSTTWQPTSSTSASSPRDLASSLVSSVAQMTSSVRILLLGCFQCPSLGNAPCWRPQEEQDGAWFDCEKLQVEQPFCYVNPVALANCPQAESPATQEPLAVPGMTPSQPKKTITSNGLPSHSLSSTELQNVGKISDFKKSSSCSSDTTKAQTEPRTKDPITVADSDHSVVYKNGEVRCSLVESFAAKLEADLRKLDCDRQRSEGEALRPYGEGSSLGLELPLAKYIETDYHENNLPDIFEDDSSDFYQYETLRRDSSFKNDVWKPSELEDAFECYNMAAFYSYGGGSMQISERYGSKCRGDKFEEVFPATFHNNNNSIKVYKPASESESPLPVKAADGIITREKLVERRDEKKLEISEDQLKHFMQSCIFVDSVEKVDVFFGKDQSDPSGCDIYTYGGRSFNRILIFDLVKEIMSKCQEQYPLSFPVCQEYPFHLVQKRVLDCLRDGEIKNKTRTERFNPSGLEVFRDSSLLSATTKSRLQQEINTATLIEDIVVSEITESSNQWKNISGEEQELKEAISNQIMDDLITESSALFNTLLKRKLLM